MLVGLPLWVWFVIFGMIMYNCYIISSTPEHFDNTKSQVVLFKAEWCGHCKRFKPEWDQLNDNQTLKNKVKFLVAVNKPFSYNCQTPELYIPIIFTHVFMEQSLPEKAP